MHLHDRLLENVVSPSMTPQELIVLLWICSTWIVMLWNMLYKESTSWHPRTASSCKMSSGSEKNRHTCPVIAGASRIWKFLGRKNISFNKKLERGQLISSPVVMCTEHTCLSAVKDHTYKLWHSKIPGIASRRCRSTSRSTLFGTHCISTLTTSRKMKTVVERTSIENTKVQIGSAIL